jgi:hypothetical protein
MINNIIPSASADVTLPRVPILYPQALLLYPGSSMVGSSLSPSKDNIATISLFV